jgi:hypothetical protein
VESLCQVELTVSNVATLTTQKNWAKRISKLAIF